MYSFVTLKEFKRNIEEWDSDNQIFYRFQNPNHEVGEKSWGMIFGSEEEAIEDAEEWGLTKETAVLPGKSCVSKFKELSAWMCEYGKDHIVIVFKGYDTYVTGHDGEYVAEFDEVVAAISYEEYLKIYDDLTR